MSPYRSFLCSLLWCCSTASDDEVRTPTGSGADHRFAEVLESVLAKPEDTASLCGVLQSLKIRSECLSIGAEALAESSVSKAQDICESIDSGIWRDECFFAVAERGDDASLCTSAGRFEEDCRMHTWTQRLSRELSRATEPGEAEPAIAALATQHGFKDNDERPWIAVYRQLLGAMKPMDRSSCDRIDDPGRQKHCRQAGLGLFHDRLNYVRDKGLFSCVEGPLPDELNTLLDDELTTVLTQRRGEDLCP